MHRCFRPQSQTSYGDRAACKKFASLALASEGVKHTSNQAFPQEHQKSSCSTETAVNVQQLECGSTLAANLHQLIAPTVDCAISKLPHSTGLAKRRQALPRGGRTGDWPVQLQVALQEYTLLLPSLGHIHSLNSASGRNGHATGAELQHQQRPAPGAVHQ